MLTLEWNSLSQAERKQVLQRPALRDVPGVAATVRRIVDSVRADGDDETRRAIARAESKPQALTLMLMSPEFQWR